MPFQLTELGRHAACIGNRGAGDAPAFGLPAERLRPCSQLNSSFFPFSIDQIVSAIAVRENGKQKNLIYTAYFDGIQIGHAQITISDFPGRIANIGSILVYSSFRCKGFEKNLVQETVRKAYDSLKMNEVRLGSYRPIFEPVTLLV